MGGEGTGRADGGRLLVSLLEITAAQRGQRPGVTGIPLRHTDPARNAPLQHGIGQGP